MVDLSGRISERKVEISIGIFLVIGISAWLFIPVVFPANTTIFLHEHSDGGGGGNGTISCMNVGNGTAFICVEGTEIDFRSILAGNGISVSNNTDIVTIINTMPESTLCVDAFGGAGFGLCDGGNVEIKELFEGEGIDLDESVSGVILISSFCESVGTGQAICTGSNNNIKSLINGTGISIIDDGEDLIISSTVTGESTICANVGTGNGIHKTGTNCNANSLIAGVGITITNTTDDWTFASQCANTGTGEAVCESSNNINSLIGGGGTTITDTTGDLTITPKWELLCQNTLSGSATSISCSGFAVRKHLIVEVITKNQANVTNTGFNGWQYNSDTGLNYYTRSSSNGGADGTFSGVNSCRVAGVTQTVSSNRFYSLAIDNHLTTGRKLTHGFVSSEILSNAVPTRFEYSCLWGNTASQITTISFVWSNVLGTPSYGINSNISVWGYD